ncbi:MAG: NAD(P)-dependent oxidoreductase, partial [Bacteroidota bacterium]
MRPKILFIDSVHPNCSDILQKSGFECFNTEGKDNNWIKEEMLSFDAVVIRSRFKITKDLLLGNKHLKCIARAGAGMENIDVEFAESIGIRCVHVPEANRDAVAEHAIGMILMLFNRLNIADSEVRKGLWRREQNRGIELKGKKVGIIGYGNMGSAFAQRLLGFDVEILAYDKYKTEYGNEKIRECNMEELYENCDVISLHLPLTEETNQLVDEKWINKFHKPFYLINT